MDIIRKFFSCDSDQKYVSGQSFFRSFSVILTFEANSFFERI